MNIDNLKRQHKELRLSIDNILNFISQDNIVEYASNIAKEINKLAGKLKMHLISEDDFLYPNLLNSSNIDLRELAEEYINQMKGIDEKFWGYKDAYNTKAKIIADERAFAEDTKKIFNLLGSRLDKEDNELYPKLQE